DRKELEKLVPPGEIRSPRPQDFSQQDGGCEVTLAGGQSADIMIRYQNFDTPPCEPTYYQEVEYMVTFTAASSDTVVKILKIRAVPRNCVVHRAFHYGPLEGNTFSASIPLLAAQPLDPSGALVARSTHGVECSVDDRGLVRISHEAKVQGEC